MSATRKSWVVFDWDAEQHYTFFNRKQAWLHAAALAYNYAGPDGGYGLSDDDLSDIKLNLENAHRALSENPHSALSENKDEEAIDYIKQLFKVYDKHCTESPLLVSEAEHHITYDDLPKKT